MRVLVIIALLLGPVGSLEAQAQGSGREKEKAKPAPKKSTPSYTDEDLKRAREDGRGNVVFLPSPPAHATDSGSAAGTEDDGKESLEDQRASWRERADERRDALKAAEAGIKALEERIAELTNDMSANPGDLFDPSRLQKREAEKHKRLAELEKAKADLEAARKARDAFEEEARSKGIPPGWLQP